MIMSKTWPLQEGLSQERGKGNSVQIVVASYENGYEGSSVLLVSNSDTEKSWVMV